MVVLRVADLRGRIISLIEDLCLSSVGELLSLLHCILFFELILLFNSLDNADGALVILLESTSLPHLLDEIIVFPHPLLLLGVKGFLGL